VLRGWRQCHRRRRNLLQGNFWREAFQCGHGDRRGGQRLSDRRRRRLRGSCQRGRSVLSRCGCLRDFFSRSGLRKSRSRLQFRRCSIVREIVRVRHSLRRRGRGCCRHGLHCCGRNVNGLHGSGHRFGGADFFGDRTDSTHFGALCIRVRFRHRRTFARRRILVPEKLSEQTHRRDFCLQNIPDVKALRGVRADRFGRIADWKDSLPPAVGGSKSSPALNA